MTISTSDLHSVEHTAFITLRAGPRLACADKRVLRYRWGSRSC